MRRCPETLQRRSQHFSKRFRHVYGLADAAHIGTQHSSGISFSRGVGLDGVERESGVCALERSRVSTAGRYEHSLRLDILNRRPGNGVSNWEASSQF